MSNPWDEGSLHPATCSGRHDEYGNCRDADGWIVGWPEPAVSRTVSRRWPAEAPAYRLELAKMAERKRIGLCRAHRVEAVLLGALALGLLWITWRAVADLGTPVAIVLALVIGGIAIGILAVASSIWRGAR